MKAQVLDCHAEIGVDYAGLDRRALIFSINFNDAFHA